MSLGARQGRQAREHGMCEVRGKEGAREPQQRPAWCQGF